MNKRILLIVNGVMGEIIASLLRGAGYEVDESLLTGEWARPGLKYFLVIIPARWGYDLTTGPKGEVLATHFNLTFRPENILIISEDNGSRFPVISPEEARTRALLERISTFNRQ